MSKSTAKIKKLFTEKISHDYLILSILAILPFLIFIEIFTGNKIFVGDVPGQDYPMRYYYGRILSQGYFPLWTSELNFGHPFFAEIHTGLLYPLNIFFSLIAYNFGFRIWQLDILCHLSIALILFYMYAREAGFSKTASLFFSICIATGGYVLMRTLHNSFLHSLVWTGGIMLYLRRFFSTGSLKSIALFSLFLLASFFAGFPPVFFMQILLTVIYSIVLIIPFLLQKKTHLLNKLPYAFAIFTIVFLLPALLYLGFVYPLVEFSMRKDWPEIMYFGFRSKVMSFFHFIYHDWFKHHPDQGNWEFYSYSGSLSVFLAFYGIRKRIFSSPDAVFWMIAGLLGLIYANADNFIYRFFFHSVPGFDYFRCKVAGDQWH